MKRLFNNFFEEKNILITGHTGFMGSWLSIWLIELGANVFGYSLPPYTKKDNFVVTNLNDKMSSYFGDVRNFNKLIKVFKKSKPDIVFHLAAQPIVRKSYEIPKETYEVNIGGTVNVFEAFRKNDSCRVLINVTTDKCYKSKEINRGYKENDPIGGFDPYSSSKACSELITSAYRQSYFNNGLHKNNKIVSSVRSGNVIGGGDWQEDRLVPDCMRALKSDMEVIIRNPQSIRPWQHVLEPNSGYLILAMKMWALDKKFSGAWNFGPDENSIFSVDDIVKKIIQYWGRGNYRTLTEQESDKLHETKMLLLDCKKSHQHLGWKPALDMDDTITLLCDWYMEDNVDYDFDVKQIQSYIKEAKKKKIEWAIS